MAPRSRRNKFAALAPLLAGLAVLLLSSLAVRADWRTDLGTFRIGVVMQNGERYDPARFEGFRKAVSGTLNMPVEIFQARDAAALIDALVTSRIEYSILSSLAYATAYELCECIEPLAAPVSRDGATAIRAVLVADSSKVRQIADLASVRVAIGPKDSLGGDLMPEAEFRWQGRALSSSGLDLVEMPSTEESLRRLAGGEVSAAFLWEYVRLGSEDAFSDGPRAYLDAVAPGGYGVLWRSDPVRFGPHAVRRNLPGEAKQALARMLEDLADTAPLVYDSVSPTHGGGFRPAGAEEYRSALALVDALKESGN